MSLFSFLRKNKQESASDASAFHSRAEEDSKAVRNRAKRRRGKGDEAADPVLPEKKRARRRLIGAVALVLAAIVGLPMVLDSEPRPIGDDVVIQIPSKEKPVPAPAPTPPVVSAAAQEPAGVSDAATLDEEEEMVEPRELVPVEAGESTGSKPQVASPEAGAATEKPDVRKSQANEKPVTPAPVVARIETHVESRAEAGRAEQIDEAARARAILEGRPDPKADDKKDSGKFVIQVAALATQEGVNELQSRLKEAGIRSYTQKIMTQAGDRTRIRVGPFASRDEAEKVRARIVKLGLNGTLVPV